MSSIEGLADGPQLVIEMVPLELIDFDPANPNEMDEDTYEALRSEIREFGFTQPAAVWPRGSRYRMIDGEHRARVLGELGAEKIPSVVVEAASEDDARIRLLSMNMLHGDMVPIRLAWLLKDLSQRIDEKDLRRRLALSAEEFRDTLRLTEFTDPLPERLATSMQREAKQAPTVVKFVCSDKDAATIERVVDKLVEAKVDRGQALARICREWERSRKRVNAAD